MPDPKAKGAHLWARDPLDHYVEPERVTAQLLAVEGFVGLIHDPCCGIGNVVKACRSAGYHRATGSDLVRRVDASQTWYVGEGDFLAAPDVRCMDNVICNPPYFGGKGTEGFIRKALAVAQGKVAVFVDNRFLTGKARAQGLWRDHPPTRVWMISPRPSCPPGSYLAAGNKAGNGSSDYVWLVWDLTSPPGSTALGWLTPADAKRAAP